MRFVVIGVASIGIAASAAAQTARVSGRVVEEGRGTAVVGATVRLTGSLAHVTDSTGRFQFVDVVPGRYIVTVSSIGFRLRTVEITVERDTTVVFELARRVVSLDTMVVRPKYLRIKGTAVDSASGDYLLQAQATLYPGSKFVGAMNGTFTFDSVPPGPITIVVEGAEHLPVRVAFDAGRDTSFRVKMGVDSVALRMIAMQVKRLQVRMQSFPFTVRAFNRDRLMEHPVMSVGEFVDRSLHRPNAGRRAIQSAQSACVFVDDRKVEPAMIDALLPELIERVEVYQNGVMVRVYTKRYVASLIGKTGLGKATYMSIGTGVVCE